ncbi:MAG: phosphate ABC transporter permease PstA [Chloroflexi bacterium]|nr:phosphate ABC transporter permease PstA [Chloroflexota bacterium]
MKAAIQHDATTEAVRRRLAGGRVDLASYIFQATLFLSLMAALGILVVLLVDVVGGALPVFAERGLDFLTAPTSSDAGQAGVAQGIFGSVVLTVVVAVLAMPIGVGAAIYLEEYATDTALTRFLNTLVRNLAGVPAIVYGLLGLAIFAQALGGLTGGRSLIAGALTLAVLVLPIVIITAAEALRAVPASIREAGFGVGATKWEVVRHHVLPYAAPGIFTGTILSLSRAFGETAPLLLVGAVTGGFLVRNAGVVEQLQGPYTALPTVIFSWTRLPDSGFRANTAAAIVVLLAVMLLVNATAIILRNRYDRRW